MHGWLAGRAVRRRAVGSAASQPGLRAVPGGRCEAWVDSKACQARSRVAERGRPPRAQKLFLGGRCSASCASPVQVRVTSHLVGVVRPVRAREKVDGRSERGAPTCIRSARAGTDGLISENMGCGSGVWDAGRVSRRCGRGFGSALLASALFCPGVRSLQVC